MKDAIEGRVRNINFIFARIVFQKLKTDHCNWFKDHVEIENIIACIERESTQENVQNFLQRSVSGFSKILMLDSSVTSCEFIHVVKNI